MSGCESAGCPDMVGVCNTQNNVGSVTLNNDLKDLIYIKIPESKTINENIIESIKIQKAIASFLNIEIEKSNRGISNLNNLILLLDLIKENILKKLRTYE